jgi:hypothetical protein
MSHKEAQEEELPQKAQKAQKQRRFLKNCFVLFVPFVAKK